MKTTFKPGQSIMLTNTIDGTFDGYTGHVEYMIEEYINFDLYAVVIYKRHLSGFLVKQMISTCMVAI